MTKKRALAFTILLAVGFFFVLKQKEEGKKSSQKSTSDLKVTILEGNSQAEKNLPQPAPVGNKTTDKQVLAANRPNPQWEGNLKNTLKTQAGNSLKNIKIVKERSFVYNKDQIPLHVESVLISLTNHQDVTASFRALVDAQTGKILETWDRPIFDPAEVRKEFRFKLDPRYTN